MKSQCQQILSHLKTGNTLTPIEALERFGCFRLGARICDLRSEGHDIRTRTISNGKKSFAEYYLAKGKQGELF